MPEPWTRRDFVAGGLFSASMFGAGTLPTLGDELKKKAAPSERIALGFIGLGGMGQGTLRGMMAQPDVEVRAVCDVYRAHLEQAVSLTNGKAQGYTDFRKLLERNDLQGVVVSTPDHWHALATIHACNAKKHVYVEKPLSHSVVEGRAMVEAARRNNCVTQMGIQIHAGENYHRVVDIVRSGVLGKIHKVRVWVSKPYTNLGKPPDGEPPAGLDWDLWTGPAPLKPFNKNRFIFNWRWFWEYGGGLLADMGCHVIDLVHWALNVEAPLTVTATGGKWVLDDNTTVPDTMEVLYEYPPPAGAGGKGERGFLMTWSHSMASSRGPEKKGLGILFHGTQGYLVADYGSFELFDEQGKPMPPPKIDQPIPRSPGHHREWLDAIKTGRRCSADIEYGHRLTTVCHLGNIALLTGRKLYWDAQAERFPDDADANQRLRREYRQPWRL